MRYLLLICSPEETHVDVGTEAHTKLMGEYLAFAESLEASGREFTGQRLKPVEHATSVRVRDGKTLVTDGPFIESKEQIGGFYIIEADDLDEAIDWARRIPSARFGTIEVRPIWEPEDYLP